VSLRLPVTIQAFNEKKNEWQQNQKKKLLMERSETSEESVS
jgi:hypothetical protein